MMPMLTAMTVRTTTPRITQHTRRFLCDGCSSYIWTSFTFSGGWKPSYTLLLHSCVAFLSLLFLIYSSSFCFEVMSVKETVSG